MRKLVIAVTAVGVLAGPAAGVASAGKFCDLQEKLGIKYIKECDDSHLP